MKIQPGEPNDHGEFSESYKKRLWWEAREKRGSISFEIDQRGCEIEGIEVWIVNLGIVWEVVGLG